MNRDLKEKLTSAVVGGSPLIGGIKLSSGGIYKKGIGIVSIQSKSIMKVGKHVKCN
jgi:hypothetical protein